jgi:hypothetical protein
MAPKKQSTIASMLNASYPPGTLQKANNSNSNNDTTPNTRNQGKRMHDYKELNDHGLADALDQETPSCPTKKSRQSSSQPAKASQAIEVEDDDEIDNEEQKKDKRRA